MKKLLLFASLLTLQHFAFSQAVWVSQSTGFVPVSSGPGTLCATDSNTVWVSAYDGTTAARSRHDYSRTTDGGINWTAGTVPVPSTYNWSMITAVDANTAWAMLYDSATSAGGGIWKTTDGGTTWNQQGVGTIFNATSFPDVVYFWDANNGVAIGDPNPNDFEIYTTTDGGTNWIRTPLADVPLPLSGEFGIVNHFCVFGNSIWFDTNKSRVYHSSDRGLHWTAASTGITLPANSYLNIAFYDQAHGIARLFNFTSGVNTAVKVTADSGATWTTITPTGKFFGNDLKYVPGTTSRLVSSGLNPAAMTGTSYSDDGGLTWVTIDSTLQRGKLAVVDSIHMWCGGFTSSPFVDGIFKYYPSLPVISCTDPSINPGIVTANDTLLCPGDTLVLTFTGVVAPTDGPAAGMSWLFSNADMSGNTDPLNSTSLLFTFRFFNPAPTNSLRVFINDGSLVDGTTNPYGVYYFTPVVFGNASVVTSPPTFLGNLSLDPLCTYTGASIAISYLAPSDPDCIGNGVHEVDASQLAVTSYLRDAGTADLRISALKSGQALINVYDMTGRVVASSSTFVSAGVNHEFLDVSKLSSGTYMIRVESNGFKAVNKLIKL